MHIHDEWFSSFRKTSEYKKFLEQPVAYFCMEYALFDHVHTYAGGLGVLSGDYLLEAVDQEFPIVAVGLYYQEDYISGEKVSDEAKTALTLTLDDSQKPVLVSIPIDGRTVYACAWRWHRGAVTAYFLDTDIPENDARDRKITARLYTEDREIRLKQEMVLGIGGFRFLRAVGVGARVYHLNEGHSIFLAWELTHDEMLRHGVGFREAVEFAKTHILFTNHTLELAGQEQFLADIVLRIMSAYAEEIHIPARDLLEFGLLEDKNLFSLTVAALWLSKLSNGVSELHVRYAKELWPDHYMNPVTNGIHIRRWDSLQVGSKEHMWTIHQENKKALLSVIEKNTGQKWNKHTLLLGWARRFVPYKQPLSLVEDVERLKRVATAKGKEIRIVFSGPLGKGNPERNRYLEKFQELSERELKGLVVFLPHYSLTLSGFMVSGCDVWANTPIIGKEACGTSGMKAALNGVLPLTTNDGWVPEVNLDGIGWLVDNNKTNESIYNILESEVIPEYYTHLDNHARGNWLERMIKARNMILPQFSATRALREYVEKYYLRIFNAKH